MTDTYQYCYDCHCLLVADIVSKGLVLVLDDIDGESNDDDDDVTTMMDDNYHKTDNETDNRAKVALDRSPEYLRRNIALFFWRRREEF